MATIDQQFIEFIVKTLVNNPDKVNVEREIDERGVLLSLTVDPEDVGRVIGKRGATAQSIRTLLRVLGTKNGARYNLKIINTDEEGVFSRPSGAPTSTPSEESFDDTTVDSSSDFSEESSEDVSDDSQDYPQDESSDASSTDELAEKTRAELADLDDLDI